MAEDDEPPPRSGGGGVSKKKFGAPIWVWAVGLGGAAGIFFFWRRSKSSSADTTSADDSSTGATESSSTSLVPINEGLSEDQTESILDAIRKIHGPPSDDDDDDKPPGPPSTLPAPVTSKPPTKPTPKPTKPPAKPKTVKVVKWTKTNTPWNSTLWGIATHEHVSGGWQALQKLNHIQGDPKKALKPGMIIKLP